MCSSEKKDHGVPTLIILDRNPYNNAFWLLCKAVLVLVLVFYWSL